MKKHIFDLQTNDYVFGKDRKIFRVSGVEHLEAHDVAILFEDSDGKEHRMLADMWHEVELASLLDWVAQSSA
jgi:mRNA degradation ribonuclease J1/J2